MQHDRKHACPSCGTGRDGTHSDWCEYKECPWCSREHRQGQCETDCYKRRSGATELDRTKHIEKATVAEVAAPAKIVYSLSYGRILRGTEGCKRLGQVIAFVPSRDTKGTSSDNFDSSEQAVDAWLSHMRGKFASVEEITQYGWRYWGLVYRCTDRRSRVILYSVMVDEQNSSAKI